MPISFNNAKCTPGLYYFNNGRSFKFSNYYLQDSEWSIVSALGIIRHKYVHHMDYVLYGHGRHDSTRKLCCCIVRAVPIYCYNDGQADYYQKNIKEGKPLEKYDNIELVTSLNTNTPNTE